MPLPSNEAVIRLPPGSIELPPLDTAHPWRIEPNWDGHDPLDTQYYCDLLRERLELDHEKYCSHLIQKWPVGDARKNDSRSEQYRSDVVSRSGSLQNAFRMQVRAEILERAAKNIASPSVNPTGVYQKSLAYLNKDGEPYIRLLRVSSDGLRAQHDLSLFRLKDAPSYTALSYSWGEAPARARVYFKHTEKYLPISEDLERALNHFKAARSDAWLWVDCMCINQANAAEKGDQVRRMKGIYERAKGVIIWIGEEMASLIGVDDQLTFCLHSFNTSHSFQQMSESALRKLLDRRHNLWWSRLWIVQEIASSSSVVVCVGAKLMPWEHFIKTVTSATATTLADQSLVLRFKAMQRQLKALYTMRKTLRSNPGGEDLLELIRATTDSSASVAIDKVYALLGLATMRDQRAIEIDYAHSAARAFAGVALHVIDSKRSLDVLVDQWCRRCGLPPDAAHDALPSWVPDFSKPIRKYPAPLAQVHNYHASNLRPPVVQKTKNPFQLQIQAVKFDVIEDVLYDCMEEAETDEELDMFRLITLPVLSQVALPALERAIPSGNALSSLDRTDSFWRTLIIDHEHDKSLPADAELGAAFESLLATNTDDLETFTAKLDSAKMKDVTAYVDLVKQTMRKRALFSTYSGFIGVGPDRLLKGDIVVVPLGSSTPLVLRPTEREGKYALVVDCYIHGIMYGELMRLLDNGAVELESMTLV